MAWFLHWFHYNYAPSGQPWYQGADWSNVFVVLVAAPLGWLWSRTKFWPLRPVRHALDSLHEKVDEHRQATAMLHEHVTGLHGRIDELHARHDTHEASLDALHAKLDAKSARRVRKPPGV